MNGPLKNTHTSIKIVVLFIDPFLTGFVLYTLSFSKLFESCFHVSGRSLSLGLGLGLGLGPGLGLSLA